MNWQIEVYGQQVEVKYSGSSGWVFAHDLTGRIVYSNKQIGKSNRINLSKLNSGFYVITGRDSESSLSRKVFIRN